MATSGMDSGSARWAVWTFDSVQRWSLSIWVRTLAPADLWCWPLQVLIGTTGWSYTMRSVLYWAVELVLTVKGNRRAGGRTHQPRFGMLDDFRSRRES